MASAFQALGWNVHHSFYYRDVQTAKAREVDVIASMAWHRSPSITPTVRLNVVAECKANAGFHVVALPSTRSALTASLDRFWIIDTDSFTDIMSAVDAAGIDPPSRLAIRKAVLDATLGVVEQPIEVRPPDITPIASGFVETNGGDGKELDQSVLWRAVLGVTSAIASLKAQRLGNTTEQISILAVVDEIIGDDAATQIRAHLISEGGCREFFHPVVFIESPLWILRDKTLESVEMLRLRFSSASTAVLSWVDVVAASAIDVFVNRITDFYAKSIEQQNVTRSTLIL